MNQNSEIVLKSRLLYFLSSERKERTKVHEVIDLCKSRWRSFIFGGMLRDIFLNGNRKFKSDIDIVVIPETNARSFFDVFSDYPSSKNKFGGLRLELGSWRMDVWPIKNTWAFKENHINDVRVEGLLRSTFFNWDAIAFDLNHNKIISAPNYFDYIENRLLDINLAKNPNPKGMLKRIVRFVFQYDAKLSWNLVQYFIHNSRLYAWDSEINDGNFKLLLGKLIEHSDKRNNQIFDPQIDFNLINKTAILKVLEC